MNTGLQDAANLSWKLAQVVHGHAGDALLDTYQAERHPVGRTVLLSSGGIVRFAMAKSPWMLALRAAGAAFLNVVGPARRMALGQVTGIGYRYRAPFGAHRLTGLRVPDVRLAAGRRLHEALRGGRFVLITPRHADDDQGGARKDRLAVEHWASDRRTALLVRPDGYVAWAADTADPAAIEAALTAHVG
jgi:hypothetical protein